MTTNSEKKDKSLAEFVVIVTLVGVMMAVFVNFYIKNESQFAQASFDSIAQTFSTKVNAVHAQWMMDKQPNVVYLASLNNKQKQAIPVNKAGWIDIDQQHSTCEAIWQLIMEVSIQQVKLAVSAVEVNKDFKATISSSQDKTFDFKSSECRYILYDGSYFQYNRAKGKVSKVFKSKSN